MKEISHKFIVFIFLILFNISYSDSFAQNKVVSYLEFSSATPNIDFGYGLAGLAQFDISNRLELIAGVRLANKYPSYFGDVNIGAIIYLKKGSHAWSCTNNIGFSNYSPFPMSNLFYRLTFAWQSKYFRIDLGNVFSFNVGKGVTKTNLFSPLFSLRGNIFERTKKYNVELFIRNFNHFESHGSRAIEWGLEFNAEVFKKLKIFIEPYAVTVGNFSGTSNFYNFKCNLGIAYKW